MEAAKWRVVILHLAASILCIGVDIHCGEAEAKSPFLPFFLV